MEAGLKLDPQAAACKVCSQTIHQAEVLKVGTLDVGSQPFAPEGEAGIGSSLLVVWHCAGSGVYGEGVSKSFLPISMWLFCHSAYV